MAVEEALKHRSDSRMAIHGALPLQAIKYTPVEQQRLLHSGNAWHQGIMCQAQCSRCHAVDLLDCLWRLLGNLNVTPWWPYGAKAALTLH